MIDKVVLNKSKQAGVIVHAVSGNGHRQAYVELFVSLFAGEPVFGYVRGALLKRLIEARQLLISMIDDDITGFARIALTRSLHGRPTAALFFRPQSCLGFSVRALAKYGLFAALKELPRQTIIAVTPFDIAPHYARVAHVGVCDPQCWDLTTEGLPPPRETALSLEVTQKAAGRRVVCFLGRLTRIKGLEFLVRVLECSPALTTNTLWVCAGLVPDAERILTQRLKTAGALIVDRLLTDAEIASLYGVSSAAWACYAPSYDQASGIFGRAIQFGVPAIVRKGSLVERFAAHHGIDMIALEYGAPDKAAATIEAVPVRQREDYAAAQCPPVLFAAWRRRFITTVEAALDGRKRCLSE